MWFYTLEVRLIPDLSDGYSKIASLLANKGQPNEAIAYYIRALETHHPDSAKIHYFMGRQKARQEDIPGAISCFKIFVRSAAEASNIQPEFSHR